VRWGPLVGCGIRVIVAWNGWREYFAIFGREGKSNCNGKSEIRGFFAALRMTASNNNYRNSCNYKRKSRSSAFGEG
jgi:hypothetical protein